MKKSLILLLLILLTGCQSQPKVPKSDDEQPKPIEVTIGSTLTLQVRPQVNLFDTIYLSDLSSLHHYSVKTSLFDATKTESLNILQSNLFSSSAD